MCIDFQDEDLEPYFQSLRQIGINLNKDKKNPVLVKFFNALGNGTRLKILKILNDKDYCVCELEAILDMSQSSISHHLKILENIGLIRGIKKGYFTHYELIIEEFQKYLKSFYEDYNF
ncbi:MAG: ArsR/SmtB family transcription factor [Promethearchaeota archaeon]